MHGGIGNQEGAIEAYEKYLVLDPKGAFSGELKQLLRALEQRLENLDGYCTRH